MNTTTNAAETLRAKLIRNLDTVPRELFERAPLYHAQSARLASGTAAKQLGVSINVLPPGKMGCPYHYHHGEEEVFIVLEGAGTLRVAGERLAIGSGDVVFIPPGPEYPHHIINTSEAPLKYLSISNTCDPDVCVYPDSNKVGVFGTGLRELYPRQHQVDYWEGEP